MIKKRIGTEGEDQRSAVDRARKAQLRGITQTAEVTEHPLHAARC